LTSFATYTDASAQAIASAPRRHYGTLQPKMPIVLNPIR
jgi:hypothetical protein